MPEQTGSDTGSKGSASLQITLAIITVSGVIGTALFANWDKIFGAGTAAPTSVVASSPSPPVETPAHTPSVATSTEANAPTLQEAGPSAQGAGGGERASAAQPSAAGVYRDTEGYVYDVRQQGVAIAFQQLMNGAVVGQGQGTIDGRTMRYGYVAANNDSGTCVAQLAESGREISGRCQSVAGGASWPFVIGR